jgi:hypothetical protein
MRIHNLTAVVFGLLMAGGIAAQPPGASESKPKTDPNRPVQGAGNDKPATDSIVPETLEAAIADALKSNPSLLAAQAQVREAELKLNATRNSLMVEVTAAHRLVVKAREILKSVQEMHKLKQDLQRKSNLSFLEIIQSEIELNRAGAALAQAESDLIKLTGRLPGQPLKTTQTGWNDTWPAAIDLAWPSNTNWAVFADGTVRYWNPSTVPAVPGEARSGFFRVSEPAAVTSTSMSDKIKSVLDQPVRIDKPITGMSVRNVLEYLRERGMQNVPMRVVPGAKPLSEPIDLMAAELPIGAWLVAVQDSVPELRFVVREYGLLVTTADRVPSDGVLLGDFLRRAKAQESKPKSEGKEGPKEGKKGSQ